MIRTKSNKTLDLNNVIRSSINTDKSTEIDIAYNIVNIYNTASYINSMNAALRNNVNLLSYYKGILQEMNKKDIYAYTFDESLFWKVGPNSRKGSYDYYISHLKYTNSPGGDDVGLDEYNNRISAGQTPAYLIYQPFSTKYSYALMNSSFPPSGTIRKDKIIWVHFNTLSERKNNVPNAHRTDYYWECLNPDVYSLDYPTDTSVVPTVSDVMTAEEAQTLVDNDGYIMIFYNTVNLSISGDYAVTYNAFTCHYQSVLAGSEYTD